MHGRPRELELMLTRGTAQGRFHGGSAQAQFDFDPLTSSQTQMQIELTHPHLMECANARAMGAPQPGHRDHYLPNTSSFITDTFNASGPPPNDPGNNGPQRYVTQDGHLHDSRSSDHNDNNGSGGSGGQQWTTGPAVSFSPPMQSGGGGGGNGGGGSGSRMYQSAVAADGPSGVNLHNQYMSAAGAGSPDYL